MPTSEHPLISDAQSLNDEDLQQRITDLQKKQGYAYRTGNSGLAQQIAMALQTYQQEYSDRLRRAWKKDDDEDLGGHIDIS